MKYIIIGNSAAAVGTVEGIRAVDKDGEITIITDEAYHVYSRPLISYYLLGKVDRGHMDYRDRDFYEKNKCRVLYNTTVDKIDPLKKCVHIVGGKKLQYDKLMLATGSVPFVPPADGLDKVKYYNFMKLDDALALETELDKRPRVLIVGGGLIGLKCAEGLVGKAESVTVVELASRILSSILDEDSSKIVQAHLENNGIEFILGESIKSYEANVAHMNGRDIPFDVLVMAVGVRPRIQLAKEAGAQTGRGITVDNTMKTTLADVYAAGDCVELQDISVNVKRVLALLPNAYIGGECAGVNMAGGNKEFNNAIPMNAIGFLGLHIITAGSYDGDGIIINSTDAEYKKLFVRDGLLAGFILVGNVDKAGIYTSLIREKKPLNEIDFDLVSVSPGLMAFSREDRARKLGGA